MFFGVSREKITPPVGCELYGYGKGVFSESVADDLTATALYFGQGEKQAVMISLTLCLLNTGLCEELSNEIERICGIPASCCFISATHTHSGPDTVSPDYDRAYTENILLPAILKAVKKASKSAVCATVSYARGRSMVGVNRRQRSPEGKVILGQNEDGIFNPLMTVVSFKDFSGKTIGNIIHYGCHNTAAGKNHEITRDWAGVMTDALEKKTGAVTAFFNGPEGDVGPRLSNKKTTGNLSFVYEIGKTAANDALNIFGKINGFSEADIDISEKILEIPLLPKISRDEALLGYSKYANETGRTEQKKAAYYSQVLTAYKNGIKDEKSHLLMQRLFRIGKLVFVSFPFEMFSEVGIKIDRAFPGYDVLSLACTCGSEGYFVTDREIANGGYEVGRYLVRHTQRYAPPADKTVISKTTSNILEFLNSDS